MFNSTVEFLWKTLEAESFCEIGSSKRPAKIIFDPIMYVANSASVIAHRPDLIANKHVLRSELAAMYEKNKELFSGRRTNFADTQSRNRLVGDAFASAISKIKKS
jgi:hypothetical protein